MKPPPVNRYRDTWAGEVRADRVDDELRVAGWVHRRRDHGGLIFIDLRDRSGLLQLVFHPETAADAHALAERLRPEHVLTAQVRVSGERYDTAVVPGRWFETPDHFRIGFGLPTDDFEEAIGRLGSALDDLQ